MELTSRDRNNILLVLLLGMVVGLAFGLSFYVHFPEKYDDIDSFGRLAARFAADLTFGAGGTGVSSSGYSSFT